VHLLRPRSVSTLSETRPAGHQGNLFLFNTISLIRSAGGRQRSVTPQLFKKQSGRWGLVVGGGGLGRGEAGREETGGAF